jgi:2-polyprenyl-3-methyl-5-hydroxy-6-metoxy-1,4-benzoquinol methylase
MIDYSRRSYKKELLDQNDIPFADIQQNMKELNFINTHLGGHSITINGFKKLLGSLKTISVCEIGCGGGDNLSALHKFCEQKNIKAKFTGIDINADCIAFAKAKTRSSSTSFIISDYKKIEFGIDKPDIIFSSLFCHHFTDEELIEMMQWMKENSTLGFFINDLHRHPVAYNFIEIASMLFSKSYLVKNDASLSVLRGFKKKEWKNILQRSGISNYTIKWKWAFRYLIIAFND